MRFLPSLPQEGSAQVWFGELGAVADPAAAAKPAYLLSVEEDLEPGVKDRRAEAAAGIFCAMSESSSLSSITMAVSRVLCGELGRSSLPRSIIVKSMASSIVILLLAAAPELIGEDGHVM